MNINYMGVCPVFQIHQGRHHEVPVDEVYFRILPLDGQAAPEPGPLEQQRLERLERLAKLPWAGYVAPDAGVHAAIYSGDTITTATLCHAMVLRAARAEVMMATPDGWEKAPQSLIEGLAAETMRFLSFTRKHFVARTRVLEVDLSNYFLITDPGRYRVQAVFLLYPDVGFDRMSRENSSAVEIPSDWGEVEIPTREEIIARINERKLPEFCVETLTPDSFLVESGAVDGRFVLGEPVDWPVTIKYTGSCPLRQVYPVPSDELYFEVRPCSPNAAVSRAPRDFERIRLRETEREYGIPFVPRQDSPRMAATVFAGDHLTTDVVYRQLVERAYRRGRKTFIHKPYRAIEDDGVSSAETVERAFWHGTQPTPRGADERRGTKLVQDTITINAPLDHYFRFEHPGCYEVRAVFCAWPATTFDHFPGNSIRDLIEYRSDWIEIEVVAPEPDP
ncbi:MAG: hypothetical protein KF858_13780 [Candidatus Sumerlaeia bacterium]|nr:hypothetical protein [Candidatus Sumerlaeia bacterium]